MTEGKKIDSSQLLTSRVDCFKGLIVGMYSVVFSCYAFL